MTKNEMAILVESNLYILTPTGAVPNYTYCRKSAPIYQKTDAGYVQVEEPPVKWLGKFDAIKRLKNLPPTERSVGALEGERPFWSDGWVIIYDQDIRPITSRHTFHAPDGETTPLTPVGTIKRKGYGDRLFVFDDGDDGVMVNGRYLAWFVRNCQSLTFEQTQYTNELRKWPAPITIKSHNEIVGYIMPITCDESPLTWCKEAT